MFLSVYFLPQACNVVFVAAARFKTILNSSNNEKKYFTKRVFAKNIFFFAILFGIDLKKKIIFINLLYLNALCHESINSHSTLNKFKWFI